MKSVLALTLVFLSLKSFAHENYNTDINPLLFVQNKALSNYVVFEKSNYFLTIKSNGIPSHAVGNFPNSGNPNHITAQKHILRVPKYPQWTGSTISSTHFGVAVNGVLFVPRTAGCWGTVTHRPTTNFHLRPSQRPRSSQLEFSSKRECEWREEAIIGNKSRLGLDDNFAHVQRNGMYHYHGVPTGLIRQLENESDKDLIMIGYAADGYEIQVSKDSKYQSSYQLKSGKRLMGPRGRFDGSYTEDFEYISGSGDLDECNGLLTDDKQYSYILTHEFPFVPRCWRGEPDESFLRLR